MLNVVFFGHLKEVVKTDTLEIDISQANQQINTVEKLRHLLQQKGEIWCEYLAYGKALVAVNQEMSSDETTIKEGDEIAFFPPVTGG